MPVVHGLKFAPLVTTLLVGFRHVVVFVYPGMDDADHGFPAFRFVVSCRLGSESKPTN